MWRLCRDIATGMRFPSFFLLLYSYSNALSCSYPSAYTSVSAGTTRCYLVFDGYGSSRKDKEQLYSTCDVSSNSFLNGSYLILLLIF